MLRCRTARERRLWRLAGALLLGIYGSAYFVQLGLLALRDRGLLGPTIGVAFVATAAALGVWLARQRPRPAELALLAATAVVYLFLLRYLTIVQERIHLLEYGALAGLLYAALVERWREPVSRWQHWPGLVACVLTAAAGWSDELLQGLLPNRVYDLRDVALNAVAGALFVAVAAARRRLRAGAATVPAPAPLPG